MPIHCVHIHAKAACPEDSCNKPQQMVLVWPKVKELKQLLYTETYLLSTTPMIINSHIVHTSFKALCELLPLSFLKKVAVNLS